MPRAWSFPHRLRSVRSGELSEARVRCYGRMRADDDKDSGEE
jgi:hypothetical protein